jgi:hypothetical protein
MGQRHFLRIKFRIIIIIIKPVIWQYQPITVLNDGTLAFRQGYS